VGAYAIIGGMDELGACLRTWRDRLQPGDVGLPAGGSRRAPGLRREEVAHLAGVSVDYLARLEQGRASNPSPSVLAPLARALRLSEEERAHLFRVAGHAEPDAGRIRRHITPGVQRVLDRLADTPVLVADVAWEIIAANRPAEALLGGDVSGYTPRDRNIARRQFTDAPTRVVWTTEETAEFEEHLVADLHDALGRHPGDEALRTLIDDLQRVSTRFAELWDQRPVARHASARKTLGIPRWA
jgi:transcriptional regulator with XRE-family HTH domain